jgi:hypothetical protein
MVIEGASAGRRTSCPAENKTILEDIGALVGHRVLPIGKTTLEDSDVAGEGDVHSRNEILPGITSAGRAEVEWDWSTRPRSARLLHTEGQELGLV